VYSFTINHQNWDRTTENSPYVIAIVELSEQKGLRVLTNIVACPPGEVEIGMAVTVDFETFEGIYLPVFAPAGDQD